MTNKVHKEDEEQVGVAKDEERVVSSLSSPEKLGRRDIEDRVEDEEQSDWGG